ncbi:universal stress protein [Pelagivirga sediminicola]|uniref:Universal stress protein n=1 Tax=Pelagivirga sediminicola TaxID=2170575 RepID=A0A2T7G9R4_9RHOB|nr:universal stress protein [Pelagivirga sediminicola]PVA11167.1 universal stress protein [Pelagivirga sediminicola]
MPLKSLFTVLTDPALIAPALDAATVLARKHDAHMDIMCLGVDASQIGYFHASASAALVEQCLARAQDQAAEIRAAVTQHMQGTDVHWSSFIEVAPMADMGRRIGAEARYGDLAVLPRPYATGAGGEVEAAAEACLFNGRLPALIIPEDIQMPPKPKRIMIAWNDSFEAMSAVRGALPILAEAETVNVVIVDPPVHGPERSDPGGRVSQFLARHGMRVEIDVLARSMPRVSDVLLRHAVDMDADLMVLGAYGHSRLREAMFGGATRNLLEQTRIPLFMAR